MPDQGITRTQRGEEQPKDKERAQTVHKTEDENPATEKQRIEEKQGGAHLPSRADQDPADGAKKE